MNLLDQTTQTASVASEGASQPTRQWSEHHLAVFDRVREPKTNIIIQAVAGGTKTSTLLEAMNHAPGGALFMAFNKAIADEIRSRVDAGTGQVKTLNALGHWQWMRNFPSATLDAQKTRKIIERRLGREHPLVKDYGYPISRLVGLAKNQAFGLDESLQHTSWTNQGIGGKAARFSDQGYQVFSEWVNRWGQQSFQDLIDGYGLDVPPEMVADVADAALKVFVESALTPETFDFDDQLWFPAFAGWQYPWFANVFVDECQDLSPIQHLMLAKLVQRGARLVAVGDRHQAIYGFRGAAMDSMDRLKRKFSMVELPLSVSYRCSQRVVEAAQLYCPHIQARNGAPLGSVVRRDARDSEGYQTFFDDPEIWTQGLIVSRNNAPLFRAILRHVRAQKPCRVLTNFLEGFAGWIRGFKSKSTVELIAKLEKWYETEKAAAEAKEFWGKVAGIEDRFETAMLLCSQYRTVDEVLDVVKSLGECQTGPTFATIHKAKGLEAGEVYLLRPDLLPAFYARSPEQLQQENNLSYVAITRAKTDLTFGVRR